MAIQTFVDTFDITTAAIGTTFTRTGYGFQPKALLLFCTGRSGSSDAVGSQSVRYSVGFATSPTDRRVMTMLSDDALATTDAGCNNSIAAAMAIISTGTSIAGQLDLQSVDADGVTFIIDAVFFVPVRVTVWALGGTDITNAISGTFNSPITTGTVSTAVTGNFQPDVVFFVLRGGSSTIGRLSLGYARSASQQGVVSVRSQDGQVTTNTARYATASECIGLLHTDATVLLRAALVQMTTTGFQLNWSAVEASGRAVSYLALKGGLWHGFDAATRTDSTAFSVSGLGFQSRGLLVASCGTVAQTPGTSADQAMLSLGVAASPSNRMAQSWSDEDNLADTETATAIEHDAVYARLNFADGLDGLMDVQSFGTDSITFLMDDPDPTAAFFWGVACGEPPSAGETRNLSAALLASTSTPTSALLFLRALTGVLSPATTTPASAITQARALTATLSTLTTTPAAAGAADPILPSEEFHGPFPSWTNVTTVYGAVGNGVADDTAALQAALDDLEVAPGVHVLYLPAGTYRITGRLEYHHRMYGRIVGADPATTTLLWDGGTTDPHMLIMNGTAYTSWSRLTFDGGGVAETAIGDGWDQLTNYFTTHNEYQDLVFSNVAYGIRGGWVGGGGFAEISIKRCVFNQCVLGVGVYNFNALDIFLWHCTFHQCGTGITNLVGAGNFRVYNCLFNQSTEVDISIGNTGAFSFRQNTSIGSNRFFLTSLTGNPCQLIVQGNRIIDCVNPDAIWVGNFGPLVCLDNTFKSLEGHEQILHHPGADGQADTICVGNTFTGTTPIAAGDRLLEFGTSIVSRASLSSAPPTMPAPPPFVSRTIYEILSTATTAHIQTAITTAATADNWSVVHFQPGTYAITSPLILPANTRLFLEGDGWGTTLLQAAGADPILEIHGPTKVQIRDVGLDGNSQSAAGILAEAIDQVGARVAAQQLDAVTNAGDILVEGLDQCQVDCRDTNYSSCAGTSVRVIGGPLAQAGTPGAGVTRFASGSSSNNAMTFAVEDGARVVVRDVWYETGGSLPGFLSLVDAGHLSHEGGKIFSTATGPPAQILLTSHSGDCLLMGTDFNQTLAISGTGTTTRVLLLGCLVDETATISDTSSPAATVSVQHCIEELAQLVNSGSATEAFVTSLLAPTRAYQPDVLTPTPAGVTESAAGTGGGAAMYPGADAPRRPRDARLDGRGPGGDHDACRGDQHGGTAPTHGGAQSGDRDARQCPDAGSRGHGGPPECDEYPRQCPDAGAGAHRHRPERDEYPIELEHRCSCAHGHAPSDDHDARQCADPDTGLDGHPPRGIDDPPSGGDGRRAPRTARAAPRHHDHAPQCRETGPQPHGRAE